MQFDNAWQTAYISGQRNGLLVAAGKVKEAFDALPATADNAVKDLLLDLYNEITSETRGE